MAASPPQTNGVHPSTPPASDNSTTQPLQPATTTAQPSQQPPAQPPEIPVTSLETSADEKKPREARALHLVLAALGIQSYQERVPLQLLDFVYRYTSSVLSDSLRLSSEGYAGQGEGRAGGGRGRGGAGASAGTGETGGDGITVTSLRQAIASRQGYTFAGHLPKEFMLEQAEERNKISLPKVENRGYGVQLPPEQYCLNGVGWNLKEEWDSEDEVGDEAGENGHAAASMTRMRSAGSGKEDVSMGGMEAADEDEEGTGRMEDVFGEDGGQDSTTAE